MWIHWKMLQRNLIFSYLVSPILLKHSIDLAKSSRVNYAQYSVEKSQNRLLHCGERRHCLSNFAEFVYLSLFAQLILTFFLYAVLNTWDLLEIVMKESWAKLDVKRFAKAHLKPLTTFTLEALSGVWQGWYCHLAMLMFDKISVTRHWPLAILVYENFDLFRLLRLIMLMFIDTEVSRYWRSIV